MATETRMGRALLRTTALLGIMALSAALALAAACGGGEESQGEPTATPTQETRTPTPSPSVPEIETPGATPTQPMLPSPTPLVVEGVSVDDDPSWGPEDAAVTIIEFSEFLCPYCLRFAEETLPQIRQAYEGKVRYVYRDFIIHGEPATKISEAAECADDQEKFWEYHDKLWENFQALRQETADMEGLSDSLESYAADLGLDIATFNDCLDTGKHTAEVQKDSQDAQSYGVRGTPGFFINGQLVSGAQPFSVFQQVIDAALAGDESGAAVPTAPSQPGG